MDAIQHHRLVRVVSVAAPGLYYDCEVTGNQGHVMVLTSEEIESYPNGKRKLHEFLTKGSVNIVKCQLWSPRSIGTKVEVLLDSGQRKVISRALIPGASKCGPKPISMERWEIREVKFRFRYQAGDFFANFYYVEWKAANSPGEWIHENQLYFKPSKSVRWWKKGVKSIPPPPLAPCGVQLATAEWNVFSTYYLKQVQVLIREGWRTSKTISGRVRQGAAFSCTPAVRDQLFMHAHKIVLTKGSRLSHYTFYCAKDLPDVFVGRNAEPWWFFTSASELVPGNILHVIYAVIGDVTVHYSPHRHRMAISFDYTVLQSSTDNIAWTRIHGCAVPNNWVFFEPEQLKQRILAKNKPYKEYFKQEEEVNVSDEDAILLAESEDGNSDVHE